MKKTGKKLAALTMAAVTAASLAACGGGSGEAGAQAGGTSSGGNSNSKLTVAIWDNGQKPGLDQIVKEFSEATGYQAEIQVITWDQYWTLLEAGASGGDMPDVFWMHSNEVQK